MGSFFSNVHVRKTEGIRGESLQKVLAEALKTQGLRQVESLEEADLSVYVYAGEAWFSVCSDGIEFYTEESTNLCRSLSENLSTEVLSIACFDSDCLTLNFINQKISVDAFAKIGKYASIKRRTTLAQWKGIVDDLAAWKEILNSNWTLVDEALDEIEPMLTLEVGQGSFADDLAMEDYAEKTTTYYYALPESATKSAPPKFISYITPTYCEIGRQQTYSVLNTGGKSKGLAIAFSGNYVEHEEIYFREVELYYPGQNSKPIPLSLEKRQLPNGVWVYYAEVPDFQILECVKDGLPPLRKVDEEMKRNFSVSFIPEGNPRKVLDITVHFIPLKNREGQCVWCAWLFDGTKRAFIEQYNKHWSEVTKDHKSTNIKQLNIEDYDIDE
ncbi:MAG: hypothetical protein IJU92_04850 [Spirochaetaceae bacterium]|nr:hypothetical protein [Spirochaetaceae bacterium]